MFLRILRASWQTIPGRSTILALAALFCVAHAAAQSSITVSVSPTSATVQAPGGTQTVRTNGSKVFLRGPARLLCRGEFFLS